MGSHHIATALLANYTGSRHKLQSWWIIICVDSVSGCSLAWFRPKSASTQSEIGEQAGPRCLSIDGMDMATLLQGQKLFWLYRNEPCMIAASKVRRLNCYYDTGCPWDLAETGERGPNCNPVPINRGLKSPESIFSPIRVTVPSPYPECSEIPKLRMARPLFDS